MSDKLTREQAMAVHDRGGKLLVSAAAGSGKTKVLVDRLMEYLLDPMNPANLDDFLIITYTKAAASELRGKIAAKLTERIAQEPENRHLQKQMQRLYLTKISTVHGFCADLLREYAYQLDLPADFRVADENECWEIRETVLTELLDRAYENLAEDEAFRAFVEMQGLGRNDDLLPSLLERVYDSSRCHQDPQGWLNKCLRDSEAAQITDASQTVWGRFLMDELFCYLDSQIHVLTQCAQAADNCDGFEKAAVNLKDTLYQLRSLRESDSWDTVIRNSSIDYGRISFPRKNNPDPELSERIKAARNACKKGLEKKLHTFCDSSDQVLGDLAVVSAGAKGLAEIVNRFGDAYRMAKQSRRVLDFSDLEHKTLDLLLGKSRSGPTAAAREIGRRFREIMVDEYQDSNGVQDAIFDALTRERHNCFMVGDVKQSIYQFRLADPGIFLKKYDSFASAEEAVPGEGRKVLLSHNFRSGPEIIEAVNDVFSTCMTPRVGDLKYGEAEALREGVPHEPLPDPAVCFYALEVQEDTYAEESAFVADQIAQMLRSGALVRKGDGLKPVEPEDIVILLRSPNSVGIYFQRALEERGIRCTSGGGMDLLQTEEIATFRCFLQTIVNPRQDIPLVSTLASPIFGFTADDLASIRSENRSGSIYDALLQCKMPKVRAFLKILAQLRVEARMSPLTELLEKCLLLTRLDSVYAAMAGGEARRANLQTFFQLAAEFEKGSLRDLGQFLEHLEALEGKGLIPAGSANAGCVTIMSIHKSKGLEFPVVFLSSLSRQFNRESLRAQVLCHKDLGLGLSVADIPNRIRYPSVSKRAIAAKMEQESLSEEMRVLYVAMTRARDRLIMSYAAKNLEADLQDIALRMDFDGGQLLCRDAVCPGDWVLLAAMHHTEAGALHALGGKPAHTHMGKYPWKIQLVQAPEAAAAEEVSHTACGRIPEDAFGKIERALTFSYPHLEATRAPSKQTATGRKGRHKDQEAAEKAKESEPLTFEWRRPSFAVGSLGGKAFGNLMHSVMQFVRYENCGSLKAIEAEVQRLAEQNFLTPQQAAQVDCGRLWDFFDSAFGRKLRSGTSYLREFKFSILDKGSNYGPGLEGERVLLQGIVDCALLEADGITVLDFKTDYVTEETLYSVIGRYRSQVNTYAEALSRIYEMPIKGKFLYLFRLNRFVAV